MKNILNLSNITNLIAILVGTAIYAFALQYFILANELMEGGITGVSVLLNYALNIPLSLSNLILNIPLFIIGWRIFGGKGFTYTIIGTLSLSLFLWIMELLINNGTIVPFTTENDIFLATLYAGLTTGLGLGIVFRYGGTTGGVDIIARIANKFWGWSIGRVILVFDAIIITSSLFYISKEKVLYTLVMAFIATRVIDIIQDGVQAARAFTIVSSESEQIANVINQEIERGVTIFNAKGAYSNEPKNVVYCVVNRQEVRKLKTLVRKIDPRAFMIISDVHEVMGEGFREN